MHLPAYPYSKFFFHIPYSILYSNFQIYAMAYMNICNNQHTTKKAGHPRKSGDRSRARRKIIVGLLEQFLQPTKQNRQETSGRKSASFSPVCPSKNVQREKHWGRWRTLRRLSCKAEMHVEHSHQAEDSRLLGQYQQRDTASWLPFGFGRARPSLMPL